VTTDTKKYQSISPAFSKWITRLLLAYFAGRLIFFAVAIASFVPPDEITHLGLCNAFSKTFLLPQSSPSTYEFGLVTNTPWLYYWSMGKLLHLNIFGSPDIIFLRLLNIPLALGTVWYALRLARLLTDSLLVHLLVIAVMTNLPMFSLLSAAVSYDNLTNLLAAMSIYYLLAFFTQRSAILLVSSLLCQLAGSLTKTAFLPLVAILGTLLLIHEGRNIGALYGALKCFSVSGGRRAAGLTVLVLIALGLNIQLYAGNYLHYGTLAPTMAQVLSPEAAMKYRIGARETIFSRYVAGEISYAEALKQAEEIKHSGDRGDTIYTLTNYEKMKLNPDMWMSFSKYARFWLDNMTGTIIGIKAHPAMFKPYRYIIPIYLLMMLSLLGFIIRWRPTDKAGWLPLCMLVIVCCYSGFLMYRINYQAYLHYGNPGVTLQGRYLFPILAPFCVLTSTYLLALFRNGAVRAFLALAVVLLLVFYDFPYFITHATPRWFAWPQK
jgi:hypothetical protein